MFDQCKNLRLPSSDSAVTEQSTGLWVGGGGKDQGGGDDQVLTIEAAGLHPQGAGKWPEVVEAKPQP